MHLNYFQNIYTINNEIIFGCKHVYFVQKLFKCRLLCKCWTSGAGFRFQVNRNNGIAKISLEKYRISRSEILIKKNKSKNSQEIHMIQTKKRIPLRALLMFTDKSYLHKSIGILFLFIVCFNHIIQITTFSRLSFYSSNIERNCWWVRVKFLYMCES